MYIKFNLMDKISKETRKEATEGTFENERIILKNRICYLELNKEETKELYEKIYTYSFYEDNAEYFYICNNQIRVNYRKDSNAKIIVNGAVEFNVDYQDLLVASKMLNPCFVKLKEMAAKNS